MANVKKRGKDVKDVAASPIFASAIQLTTILLMENCSYIIQYILENGVNVIQKIVSHLGKMFLARLNTFESRVSLADFKLTDVSKRYVGRKVRW